MKEIISLLPSEIIILIILLIIISIILFAFIDKFYSIINYKARFIYYLEFFLEWEKISKRMNGNKKAKKYFKIIILINVILLITSIIFLVEIFNLNH